ncbi:SDR family NAD(P)-dependent oxidoreductase [Paramagnetospirillum magneticum]|uniref:Dehydrogenase with different specificities n=1 Tax=Paramagnetospirillum magneticum (strain ATCC 700264 / AMB-1) TaxID=342108 RepID=Q2W5I3_PARM1|nr:SDR family NAD(P)-dependent oxidoreductase [Paramagnetospirillum magneticum]BAE50892.1 Dehydrogenase with different specificities [Paramagnetospirillum magneticum AMB-1]
MSGRLEGRVALVTGASRGIGAAVARRLAAEGAEIVAIARTQGALEELDDQIRKAGGKPLVLVPEDLCKPGLIEQVAAAIFQRWARLDILVGNAGAIGGGLTPVAQHAPDDWEEAFAVNVTANWRLIRACDPLLRMAPAGRAVFTTADAARHAEPFWGAYAASKAALETMVRTWAAEIANVTSVKANLLDPGVVATRLRSIAFPGEDPAKLAQPDDVAGAFLDLCLPDCTRQGEIIRTSP